MNKETLFITGVLLSLIIIGAFSGWRKEKRLDRELRIEEMKMFICQKHDPSVGDYVWRYDGCDEFERKTLTTNTK